MRKPMNLTLLSLFVLACAGAAAWALLPAESLPFGRDPDRKVLTQVIYHHKRVRVNYFVHHKAKLKPKPKASVVHAVAQVSYSAPSSSSRSYSQPVSSVKHSSASSPQTSTSHTSGGRSSGSEREYESGDSDNKDENKTENGDD